MSKPLFDRPPTYACPQIRVDVPSARRHMPLNPMERWMVTEVRQWERGVRAEAPPPTRGLPGLPAPANPVGQLLREKVGDRVLSSRDVRPLTAVERALVGPGRSMDRLMEERPQAIQRGIEAGTRRHQKKEQFEGWEDYSAWFNRMKGK